MESVTLAKVTGTYINLQDAYAVEANKLGSWQMIGYSAPGELKSGLATGASREYNTTNFKYVEGVAGSADWTATANVKLNDCPQTTGTWAFKSVFSAGGQDQGDYSLSFVDNNSTGACKGLTPSFERVLQASR